MTQHSKNKMIAANIRLYRIKAQLTQTELAKRISRVQKKEFKRSKLRYYEKGDVIIPSLDLYIIASALNISPNNFLAPFCYEDLLDKRRLKLIELFNTMKTTGLREAVICILKGLARK